MHSGQGSSEKFPVDGVEDERPHDRTSLLTGAIDSRYSFPEGFAGLENGFAGRGGMFRQKRARSSAGKAVIQRIRPLD